MGISYMGVCFIILTLWLAGLMIKAVPIIKNKKEFILVMVIIILTLCISFYIDNFLLYYIWFEISLIPIFIIILGWGYQPERILASIIIFFLHNFSIPPITSVSDLFNRIFRLFKLFLHSIQFF